MSETTTATPWHAVVGRKLAAAARHEAEADRLRREAARIQAERVDPLRTDAA